MIDDRLWMVTKTVEGADKDFVEMFIDRLNYLVNS